MSKELANSGEILLYSHDGAKEFINVYFKDETFWLTQSAMAELFDCSSDNISLHLKNIYDEELDRTSTTEDFSVVRKEGNRMVNVCFADGLTNTCLILGNFQVFLLLCLKNLIIYMETVR